MTNARILVAGIGNIFLGDDAFGSEVARRLQLSKWPDEVRVIDFGIRGLDLVYEMLEGFEFIILVDAAPRGEAPGTLYTIKPDLDELDGLNTPGVIFEPHAMNPMKVLAMARSMGAEFRRILLVGCEPAQLESDEGDIGLSEPVAEAADRAVELIGTLVASFLSESNNFAASALTEGVISYGK